MRGGSGERNCKLIKLYRPAEIMGDKGRQGTIRCNKSGTKSVQGKEIDRGGRRGRDEGKRRGSLKGKLSESYVW